MLNLRLTEMPACAGRPAASTHLLLVLALMFLILAGIGCSGNTESDEQGNETGKRQLIQQMADHIRVSEIHLAHRVALRYLDLYPGTGDMYYNLACLECILGNSDAGWEALVNAFEHGYGDFRHAGEDPDLQTLTEDPRFATLRQQTEQQYQRLAMASRFELGLDHQSPVFALQSNNPVDDANELPTVEVSFTYDVDGLEVNIEARDQSFQDQIPPWQHGSGPVINICVPSDSTAFESDVFYSFGFGLENGKPTGAAFVQTATPYWQPVGELTPRIQISDDQTSINYTCRIPWQSIVPYSPFLDPVLGVNVTYQRLDSEQLAHRVALVPDPLYRSRTTNWRRFAPVSFIQTSNAPTALLGKADNTIAGQEPVDIELVAYSPTGGNGSLQLELLSVNGKPVMPGAPQTKRVTINPGRNSWQRQADLSQLPTGPYSLQARLTLPDGQTVSWDCALLRLDNDWIETAGQRMDQVSFEELPSVLFRFEAIQAALQQQRPRQDPSPLATTLMELELMLSQQETTGTIFPSSGPFLGAYPGFDVTEWPCALFLPPNFSPGNPYRVLLLLSNNPGSEERLTSLIGRELASGGDMLVVAPLLNPTNSNPNSLRNEAEAAINWLQELIDTGPVMVAGIDYGATAALQLSLESPDLVAATLILAGARYAALPGVEIEDFPTVLSEHLNDRSYTWVTFDVPAESARRIEAVPEALAVAGFSVDKVLMKGNPDELRIQKQITHWARGDHLPPK